MPKSIAPFMKPKLVPPWNMYRLIETPLSRISDTTASMSANHMIINDTQSEPKSNMP